MALVAFVAFGLGVTPGHASPCGDEIARLENTLSQAKNDPAIGTTAPQSDDAQLGYQPTPDLVKRAEADASSFRDHLEPCQSLRSRRQDRGMHAVGRRRQARAQVSAASRS
jgi:hypothetical protein